MRALVSGARVVELVFLPTQRHRQKNGQSKFPVFAEWKEAPHGFSLENLRRQNKTQNMLRHGFLFKSKIQTVPSINQRQHLPPRVADGRNNSAGIVFEILNASSPRARTEQKAVGSVRLLKKRKTKRSAVEWRAVSCFV